MWPFKEKYTELKVSKEGGVQLSGPKPEKPKHKDEIDRQFSDIKKNFSEVESHFDEMRKVLEEKLSKK